MNSERWNVMQQIIRNTGVKTTNEPPMDTDKDREAMEKLK
jgi:hypothetical protein